MTAGTAGGTPVAGTSMPGGRDLPSASRHQPVMLAEVLEALSPRSGEVFVDGTFGGGGYAAAILAAAQVRVYGIDRDPDAIARARSAFAGQAATQGGDRLTLIQGRYGEMAELLAAQGVRGVDGVVLDLGVSSDQIDTAERGFAFSQDGPLDMRMERGGPDAASFVNTADEQEIADIVYRYGEERRSRAVARAIVSARARKPIHRTAELAEIVARAVGRVQRQHHAVHPATRTFQALRIHVNDELGELARGLSAAERLLLPGGRLAVVSFHSLEDRIVKEFLAPRSGRVSGPSRHAPLRQPAASAQPSFTLKWRGVRRPGDVELSRNPRARSARLRAAIRTDAPAWEPRMEPGDPAAIPGGRS